MAGRKRKNNAEYFSHDSGMRNDEKVKVLRSKFGVDGYAFWNMFLEVLCDRDNFKFERTDISIMILSGDTGFDESSISEMLDYLIKLEMLQCEESLIYSQNMMERFEPLLSKRTKMREVYQTRIDKQKAISEAEINNSEAEKAIPENSCDSLPSEIPQRKGKERKGKGSNKKTIVYSEQFESWWKIFKGNPDHGKGDKEKAFIEFKKIPEDQHQDLMTGTKNYGESTDGSYKGMNFLKQEIWKLHIIARPKQTDSQESDPNAWHETLAAKQA